uniref:TauD/TfdA-like domain-containing protein n=1 Tax=Panagrolaimus superbus TaxID=310955 RepID=A0A914YAI4_9BILA
MRSWYFGIEDGTKIQEIYQALKIFTSLCYAPENQLIFPLENGDTVLWANTRCLHARSGYQSTTEDNRSIFGCYFMWDIIKSRIRVIRDKLNLPENQNSL